MIRSTTPVWPASSASSERSPRAQQGQRPRRQPGPLGGSDGHPGEHRVGVGGGAGAAQNDGVAGLQTQRGGIDGDVRPGLVDDRDHAQRDPDATHAQAVGEGRAVDHLADRVRQGGDRPHAGCHLGDPARVESEAVQKRRREAVLAAELEIAGVGLQDICGGIGQRGGNRLEDRVLDRGAERRELARSALRGGADLGDGDSRAGHDQKVTRACRPVRGRPSGEHEVVPVDRFVAGSGQALADGRRLQAADLTQLDRRVVADALADRLLAGEHLDGITGHKGAGDLHHPHRQQAGAALAQGVGRPGVDEDASTRRLGVLQPQLEARIASFAGHEAGPDVSARRGGGDHPRLEAARDHGLDPGRGGHLGRHDLGAHASRAQRRSGVADVEVVQRREVLHLGDPRRLGVAAGVSLKHPTRVG